jgi:hypothetical protein
MSRLRRHPLAMSTRFRDATVLTYAFPEAVLRPLIPPTLDLETREGLGFVAVALVDMEGLRPARLPRWAGTDATFVGYRVFVRAELVDGRIRRGLKVIRTDVDRVHLLVGTRLVTRYGAGLVSATWRRDARRQRVEVRSRWRGCDLAVETTLDDPATPPPGSPFRSWSEAKPFSGPLPWTFAPSGRARSVVGVKGVRSEWSPRPVTVRAHQVAFFSRPPFVSTEPVLASAFHVADVAYSWRAGEDVAVRTSAGETS